MITYPLIPPTSPAFSRVSWAGEVAAGISRSEFSFAQQVQLHLGETLLLNCELPKMRRAAAEDWIGFRLSLRGLYGSFLLTVDPSSRTPRGTWAGAPVADSAGSPTVNYVRAVELHLRGLSNGATIKRGDWLSFNDGSKWRLHKNLTDVTVGASGLAVLDIFPRLRRAVPDNTAIVTTDPKGTFRMGQNTMPWDVEEAQVYGIQFSAFEDLTP